MVDRSLIAAIFLFSDAFKSCGGTSIHCILTIFRVQSYSVRTGTVCYSYILPPVYSYIPSVSTVPGIQGNFIAISHTEMLRSTTQHRRHQIQFYTTGALPLDVAAT